VNEFDPFVYRGGFLLVDIATLLAIAAVVHPAARCGRLLGLPPLVWLGKRSYGIYLWHWPIYVITRPGLDVPLRGFPLLVLRLSLTLLAADLTYRYIEQPIRSGAIGRWTTHVRASRGERRARLLGHGAFIAASLVLTACLLTVGLVNATSEPVRADQIAAESEENPGLPVSAAMSSTSAPGEDGQRGGKNDDGSNQGQGRGQGASPTTTSVPRTMPPGQVDGARVLAIGDSVMLGASPQLFAEMPGILVDAKVSRSFPNAIEVLSWYAANNMLRDVVVVHMGTNGAFSDEQFDQLMSVAGDRPVVFLNARVPRSWEGLVNARLAAGVARHPNATLIDWRGYAGSHDDWFAGDGFHVEAIGGTGYAEILEKTIARVLD
jgi:hypothetical protein